MRSVLFTVPDPAAVLTGHAGYLAGRYRDRAYSDLWTDASRCAEQTFVAYAPRRSCGWRGTVRPADEVGRLSCQREWLTVHVAAVQRSAPERPAPRRRDKYGVASRAELRQVGVRSASG